MMAGFAQKYFEPPPIEDRNAYILRTDQLGNIVWEKTYDLNGTNDPSYYDMVLSLKLIGDGQYTLSGVTGYHLHYGGVEGDIFLMKIDDDGTIVNF